MKHRVRIAVIVAIAVLLLLGISLVFFGGSTPDDQHAALGPLVDRETVEHSFTIRNVSLWPLGISAISTSCGCTVVEETASSIPPFSALTIPVKVDLREKSGEFKTSITVVFDNSETTKLTIEGKAINQFPREVIFGKILKGESSLHYTIDGGDKAESTEIYRDDIVSASVQFDSELSSNVITFGISDTVAAGEFDRAISIPMAVLSLPDREVHVSGHVREDVEPSPETLSIGYITQKSDETKPIGSLVFSSPYGKKFSLDTSQSSIPPYFKTGSVLLSDGRLQVDLFLTEFPVELGSYRGNCTFAFDVDGANIELAVPVLGYFMALSDV